MGNSNSMTTQPLALIAVARKLKLQRIQIVSLRDALASFADDNGLVDKPCFSASLAKANITSPDDVEIFDLLFIMWDSFGREKIPYKPFSVGVSPLACQQDDVVSVLRFAMHIQDDKNTGMLCSKALLYLLHWIHTTASFFGDPQLDDGDIAAVVETVFDKQKTLLTHTVCARRLQANAYIKRFVSGKERSRVQFKEDLTVVTEFAEDDAIVEKKKSECTSPIDTMGSLMRDNFWAFDSCISPGGDLGSLLDSRDSWDSILSEFTDDSPFGEPLSLVKKTFGQNHRSARLRIGEQRTRAE